MTDSSHWALLLGLRPSSAADLVVSRIPGVRAMHRGEVCLLGPSSSVSVALAAGGLLEMLYAPIPPTPDAPSSVVEPDRLWSIELEDVLTALEPRGKLKVAEPSLWRPSCPAGRWGPGTEIESPAIALGAFRSGAPETAHVHDRTWELYQVVEGALDFAARDEGATGWAHHELHAGEVGVVAPGTEHLVSEASRHVTFVMQIPPASGDRRDVEPP